MKPLRLNDKNNQVIVLQRLLQKTGYFIPSSGEFNAQTEAIVRDFQGKNGLQVDGIVGKNTWSTLWNEKYDFSLGAKNYFLEKSEYFPQYEEKKVIYLHHTDGRHPPDYTIAWREQDNKLGELRRVGTSFVIGRISLDGDTTFDCITYRAFNEIHWAHHLGLEKKHNNTSQEKNIQLNAESIAIEICALGPLKKERGGRFSSALYQNIVVPEEQVCELDKPQLISHWKKANYQFPMQM